LEVARTNLANNRKINEKDEEEELQDSRDILENSGEKQEKKADDLESTDQMNDLSFQQNEIPNFKEVPIQISDSNILENQNEEAQNQNFLNLGEASFPTNIFEF